jgi:hypothetical protein
MQMPTFPLIWSISQSDELIMTYARHELYYPVVAFWTNEGTLGGFSFHDWLNDDNPSSRWIESMMPPPFGFLYITVAPAHWQTTKRNGTVETPQPEFLSVSLLLCHGKLNSITSPSLVNKWRSNSDIYSNHSRLKNRVQNQKAFYYTRTLFIWLSIN